MPIRNVGSDTPSSESVMNTCAHEAAAAQRRVDAHRDADASARKRRDERELERGREALRDQARHLGALAQRQAEFALRGVAEEVPELHEERLVEAELGAQLAHLLGRRVLAEQEHDRIADVLEQQEGDEGDRDHHDHGLDQAAQDKGEHSITRTAVRC